jgi:TorA maturation chaperone TorD
VFATPEVHTATIKLRQPLPPEDQARADFYALLARLYAEGPDEALLAAIAAAPRLPPAAGPIEDGNADGNIAIDLPAAWAGLSDVSAITDAAAARLEYDELFIGVGKSEVNLHASHWLTGFMMEKPLVDVRTTLAELGLGRRDAVTLVEDHLAALCETMRLLIAGDDGRNPLPLSQQRDFFERHIGPWSFRCCSAINKSPVANYYRAVAQFTYCYLALERDSLAME